MLSERSEAQRISSLEAQVLELGKLTSTMERYLEEIMDKSVGEKSESIIDEETVKLSDRRVVNELEIFLGSKGDLGSADYRARDCMGAKVEVKGSEAIPCLTKILPVRDPDQRAHAAHLLGTVGNEEVVPLLEGLLDDMAEPTYFTATHRTVADAAQWALDQIRLRLDVEQ